MDRRIADRRIDGVNVGAPYRAFFTPRGTFEFEALTGFEADHGSRHIPQRRCLVLGFSHYGLGVWGFENEALLIRAIRAGRDAVSFTAAIDGPALAQFDGDGAALLIGYQSAMDASGAD